MGKEKAWGPWHASTLDTVNDLANFHKNQGKMAKDEDMYERAMDGKEKAYGLCHTVIIRTRGCFA